MNSFQLKVDLILFIGFLTSLIPLWSQLEKILGSIREEAKARVEISSQIEFISQRLDRIEDFIARNSGLRM